MVCRSVAVAWAASRTSSWDMVLPLSNATILSQRRDSRCCSRAHQTSSIVELARDLHLSVKDSFSCLNLSIAGFQMLFDAHWLYRRQSRPPVEASTLDWRRIANEQGLTA